MATAFNRPRRDDRQLTDLGRCMIERLSGGADAREPDARVQKIVEWAQAQIDNPIGLADAARLVGLSKQRLRHLFVEQTGLPFRTYLLWLRLMKGLEEYSTGASLTDAAHDAGFADSAHFSRTFRRMFGTTAAALDVK
jgi:transcriptional regulator GlxA family with amidase domain